MNLNSKLGYTFLLLTGAICNNAIISILAQNISLIKVFCLTAALTGIAWWIIWIILFIKALKELND